MCMGQGEVVGYPQLHPLLRDVVVVVVEEDAPVGKEVLCPEGIGKEAYSIPIVGRSQMEIREVPSQRTRGAHILALRFTLETPQRLCSPPLIDQFF